MRSNRRRHSSFHTVNTRLVAFFALLVLICAGGAIVNLSLRSSVSAICRDIKKLESEQKAINEDIQREKTNWAAVLIQWRLRLNTYPKSIPSPMGRRLAQPTRIKHGLLMIWPSRQKTILRRARIRKRKMRKLKQKLQSNG